MHKKAVIWRVSYEPSAASRALDRCELSMHDLYWTIIAFGVAAVLATLIHKFVCPGIKTR